MQQQEKFFEVQDHVQRFSFLRQHWHIVCVICSLLVLLIFIVLGVNQSVIILKDYPTWVMVTWISFNVVLFLVSILLILPYIFYSVRTEDIDGYVVASVAGFAYICGGTSAGATHNGAFVFSCTLLIVLFTMLVADIVRLAMRRV